MALMYRNVDHGDYGDVVNIDIRYGYNAGRLRGYKSDDKNATLVPIKPDISDKSVTEFLNSNNLMFCGVEFFFDTIMPSQVFIIVPQNINDLDLLKEALTHIPFNYIGKNITEIHITPVYQKIQGYPKVFSDNSITILSTLVFKTYANQVSF